MIMEMSDVYRRRFAGIARLYGALALEKFCAARVCVIGVGGVGSWAGEALARSGVGRVTLIDLDDVCISNTNRQLPAMEGQFGRMKVAVLAERMLAINPEIQIQQIEDFIAPENFAEYLVGQFDFVIDCIDSVKTKAALIAWCRRNKMKLITVGGAGGQIDPTQILVDDLSRTIQDPLASKVRSLLRRDYQFPKAGKKFGIECVRLDCEGGFGAAMTVTATFGLVAVSRVLKALAKD
jgi:tRNA threonylcarbamoyladenosine dehydratase